MDDVQTPVCLIYIRFSTPKQEKEGGSEARQTDLCEAYAKRLGWKVGGYIKDLGKSAWSGAHLESGNLGKFANRVRAGEIPSGTILLVENLDRLSREGPDTAHDWMRDMFRHGLKIAAVASGDQVFQQGGSLVGTIEILLKAQLAETESTNKSLRVQKAFTKNLAAAYDGRIITTRCPGWLVARADRSGFDKIKDHAETVRHIYQMSADGFGSPAIAKRLNDMGRKPWGLWRKGTQMWESSSVAMILKHPAVEGDYVRGWLNPAKTGNGERIVGYYGKGVVDADLVARARANIAKRDKTGGARRSEVVNLFTGAVVCGACGSKMHLRSGQKKDRLYRYFHCSNAYANRGCTQSEMFAYGPFEIAALNQILHLALDDSHFQRGDQSYKATVDLAAAKKHLADIKEADGILVGLFSRTQSPSVEEQITANVSKIAAAKVAVEAAEKALQAARGAVSPAEHLRRVVGVRDALNDPDKMVRTAARMKVVEAIKGVGCEVKCEVQGRDRQFLLTMAPPPEDAAFQAPGLAVRFDNKGTILQRFDFTEAMLKALAAAPAEERAAWLAMAGEGGDLTPDRAGFQKRSFAHNGEALAAAVEAFEADARKTA